MNYNTPDQFGHHLIFTKGSKLHIGLKIKRLTFYVTFYLKFNALNSPFSTMS